MIKIYVQNILILFYVLIYKLLLVILGIRHYTGHTKHEEVILAWILSYCFQAPHRREKEINMNFFDRGTDK